MLDSLKQLYCVYMQDSLTVKIKMCQIIKGINVIGADLALKPHKLMKVFLHDVN